MVENLQSERKSATDCANVPFSLMLTCHLQFPSYAKTFWKVDGIFFCSIYQGLRLIHKQITVPTAQYEIDLKRSKKFLGETEVSTIFCKVFVT